LADFGRKMQISGRLSLETDPRTGGRQLKTGPVSSVLIGPAG
jgi:hypothetical protein